MLFRSLKHDHILQIFGANLNSNQLILVCALKPQGDVCMYLHNNPSADRRKLVRKFVVQVVCASFQVCLLLSAMM